MVHFDQQDWHQHSFMDPVQRVVLVDSLKKSNENYVGANLVALPGSCNLHERRVRRKLLP